MNIAHITAIGIYDFHIQYNMFSRFSITLYFLVHQSPRSFLLRHEYNIMYDVKETPLTVWHYSMVFFFSAICSLRPAIGDILHRFRLMLMASRDKVKRIDVENAPHCTTDNYRMRNGLAS